MADNQTERRDLIVLNQFTIFPGVSTNSASSLKPYMSLIMVQSKVMFAVISLGPCESFSHLRKKINYVQYISLTRPKQQDNFRKILNNS